MRNTIIKKKEEFCAFKPAKLYLHHFLTVMEERSMEEDQVSQGKGGSSHQHIENHATFIVV